MAKCICCGKQSLFLRVNKRNLCTKCENLRMESEMQRLKDDERKKKLNQPPIESVKQLNETERNSRVTSLNNQISSSGKKPGSFFDLKFPIKVGSSICVYRYWLLQVEPIDINEFNSLYCGVPEYSLLPTILDSGDVVLTHDGTDICKLLDKREMVSDWVKRSDTMICRISSCNPDKYGVAVAFYRDEARRLGNKPNTVVKLTSYASEEKQISISCCSDGQKLVCYEDDDGKRVYVSDIFSGGVIGYLPAKYAAMYLDSGFTGIFFDHSETDDEREREVPFVKIYP